MVKIENENKENGDWIGKISNDTTCIISIWGLWEMFRNRNQLNLTS